MKRYTGIKGKLDKLVGGYFRSRPCEYHRGAGCKGNIEWVHLKSRGYLSVRWEPLNCFSFCSKRHFYWHQNPDEFVVWVQTRYPGRWEKLQAIFTTTHQYSDHDFENLYERLKQQLNPR